MTHLANMYTQTVLVVMCDLDSCFVTIVIWQPS